MCPIAVDHTSSATLSSPIAILPILSWTHTVGSGSDRILIVGVSARDTNRLVTSVTYAGRALTQIGAENASSNANRIELWYLLQPPIGTANVTVTLVNLLASVDVGGGAASFTGVNQGTPLGSFVADHSTGTTASVTVPSAAGQVIVDVVAFPGSASPVTAGSGQTQQWGAQTGSGSGDIIGLGSTKAGASSVTMSWTGSSSQRWSQGAVALRPLLCMTESGAQVAPPSDTPPASPTPTSVTPAATSLDPDRGDDRRGPRFAVGRQRLKTRVELFVDRVMTSVHEWSSR